MASEKEVVCDNIDRDDKGKRGNIAVSATGFTGQWAVLVCNRAC